MGHETSTINHGGSQPDPLASWLALVAGLLVVVVLSAVLAFTLYLRSIQGPRNELERRIETYTARVADGSASQDDLVALAVTYAQAGRSDKAADALSRAYEPGETALVVTADGDIARLERRYEDAVERYDRAVELAQAEHTRIIEDLREKQVVAEPANERLASAVYGRALALGELGEHARALTDLEQAVEIVPTDADLLAALGDAYAATGDVASARESYDRALEFVANHPGALAGLAALEDEESGR